MDKTHQLANGAVDVDAEIRRDLIEPFIAAATAALGEMAGVEVAVQSVSRRSTPSSIGDIFAVVEILAPPSGYLVVSLPLSTATGFAGRILAGVAKDLDAGLIRDCMGEVANVICGQAKAMLAAGPNPFIFAVPKLRSTLDEFQLRESSDCLVVAFRSEQGNFALQLLLNPVARIS